MRFYLADRITKLDVGVGLEGEKTWPYNDDVFRDHFPGNPIVPGVFLIESSAQLGSILVEDSYAQKYSNRANKVFAILGIVRLAKFKKFVGPGERVDFKIDLTDLSRHAASIDVAGLVDDEKRYQAAITYTLIPESVANNPKAKAAHEEYRAFLLKGLRNG
jgi:3-hydroxyacyl-[acyl-carrier-protein] dehydratase